MREVKLPCCNIEAHAIEAPRAKDRRAKFSFLDFPPEIRNIVYGLLFVAKNCYGPPNAEVVCHPAILASCKQVNTEATGIFYATSVVPISISLRKRPLNCRSSILPQRQGYGVDIVANGKTVFPGQEQFQGIGSVSVDVELSRPQLDIGEGAQGAGAVQANHAFFHLYRLLKKSSRIRWLRINLTSDLNLDIDHHYAHISPLFAASAIVTLSICELHGITLELKSAFENSRASFRKILDLEEEVKLQTEIFNSSTLELTRGEFKVYSPSNPHLRPCLEECKGATSIRRMGTMYSFATEAELKEAIDFVEPRLDDAYEALRASQIESATLKELEKMRMDRSAAVRETAFG